MIHAGRKSRTNSPGYLSWSPAPCFFLFTLLFVPDERVNRLDWGRRFRLLSLDPFLLLLFALIFGADS